MPTRGLTTPPFGAPDHARLEEPALLSLVVRQLRATSCRVAYRFCDTTCRRCVSPYNHARRSSCSTHFLFSREWPKLLQDRARRQVRSACIGVKCHKWGEPNLLNHKGNVRAAPHDADYLHNRPRNIRAVILHSDSKGQRFESSRARQPAERSLSSYPFGGDLSCDQRVPTGYTTCRRSRQRTLLLSVGRGALYSDPHLQTRLSLRDAISRL